MRIITRMLKGTCVYWGLRNTESGGIAYDNFGQPQFTDPVELDCRWSDVKEEFVGPTNTREISKARVYVSSDVVVGGVLMNGTLLDITDAVVPLNNSDTHAIKSFKKIPNFKQTVYLRKALL